ncbi:hypothetical protein [Pedobacter caeni]|nr:hypothetical protein [Pedobacter caeni]
MKIKSTGMLMSKYLLVFVVLIFTGFSGVAQGLTDCEKILDQEPYFVRHKSGAQDQALKRDIEILKRCGNFDPVDSAFLKGPMLGTLMLQEVRAGKPATYRTIINFFSNFRKTAEYKDFSYGLSMYRKLGGKKVSLTDWETDKELFVRMGFTVNDLEDFKIFITQKEHSSLTYMQAFSQYMSEIEAMRVDK